jgi:hypothetical protein
MLQIAKIKNVLAVTKATPNTFKMPLKKVKTMTLIPH